MTRSEILEYLNYQGVYTKDIKKKLNKLIKKYHPDKNKNDNKTILILYDIKKKLENGTLEYTETSKDNEFNTEDKQEEDTYYVDINFVERLLKILTKEKNFIEKRLEKLYRRAYFYNNKIYKSDYEIGFIEIEISNLISRQRRLKSIDFIDITSISCILILLGITIYLKKIYVFIICFLFICNEVIYIRTRYRIYKENIVSISKLKSKRSNLITKENNYKKKINEMEGYAKKERNRVNNDIAFYNYELDKRRNKINKIDNLDYSNSK